MFFVFGHLSITDNKGNNFERASTFRQQVNRYQRTRWFCRVRSRWMARAATILPFCRNFELKCENFFRESAPPRNRASTRLYLAPSGKADTSGREVRCTTRYLVGIYVCHDSLLLGSQLIRIRLEPTTGNSREPSLKHAELSSFKFSALNLAAPPFGRGRAVERDHCDSPR